MKSEEKRILVGETEEEAEINEIKSHALVDDETKVINFNNLRVTDLPTNRQVGVSPWRLIRLRSRWQVLKLSLSKPLVITSRASVTKKVFPKKRT